MEIKSDWKTQQHGDNKSEYPIYWLLLMIAMVMMH